MKSIFVSIGSYNESDLLQTIESALKNAEYPERIHFGICENRNDNNFTNLEHIPNLRKMNVYSSLPLGLGFSRSAPLQFIDNEDYYFQTDAHMLFDKNWDSDLIYYHEIIKKDYNKPIISSYTSWWGVENDGSISRYNPENITKQDPMCIHKDKQVLYRNGYIVLGTEEFNWENELYKEHYFIGGAMLFADIKFAYEIMPDPFIKFDGDEQLQALRAYTRGYRIFAIPKNIVWHKNKYYNDEFKKPTEWRSYHKYANKEDTDFYWRKMDSSLWRIKNISTGQEYGYWGSPNPELLKQYEEKINLSFKDFYQDILENGEERFTNIFINNKIPKIYE
jgi:hypothetical protein